jgi:hypothetical protein
MATTVSNATLKITIEEEITLKGQRQGSKVVKRIPNINEIIKRIATVPVSGSGTVTLFRTTGDSTNVINSGKMIETDIEYFRITNLNDTSGEGIKLQIARDDNSDNSDDEILWYFLEPGKSFILGKFDAAFDAASTDTDSPTFDSITEIRALNESSDVAVDVEIFAASL